jgi:hypothetical protein
MLVGLIDSQQIEQALMILTIIRCVSFARAAIKNLSQETPPPSSRRHQPAVQTLDSFLFSF